MLIDISYITLSIAIIMSDLHELSGQDFRAILVFTTGLARRAGALILEGSAAIHSASYESGVGEKKNSVDLVTEYDVKVEQLVQDELKIQFPTFSLSVFRATLAVSSSFIDVWK